jgi:methyl-accepting chemotaxis protein
MLKNVKISTKLPLQIVMAALLSCAVIGIMATRISEDVVISSIENKLESLLTARKVALEEYLNSIKDDLAFVATNKQTIAAVKEFSQAWREHGYGQETLLQDLYIK